MSQKKAYHAICSSNTPMLLVSRIFVFISLSILWSCFTDSPLLSTQHTTERPIFLYPPQAKKNIHQIPCPQTQIPFIWNEEKGKKNLFINGHIYPRHKIKCNKAQKICQELKKTIQNWPLTDDQRSLCKKKGNKICIAIINTKNKTGQTIAYLEGQNIHTKDQSYPIAIKHNWITETINTEHYIPKSLSWVKEKDEEKKYEVIISSDKTFRTNIKNEITSKNNITIEEYNIPKKSISMPLYWKVRPKEQKNNYCWSITQSFTPFIVKANMKKNGGLDCLPLTFAWHGYKSPKDTYSIIIYKDDSTPTPLKNKINNIIDNALIQINTHKNQWTATKENTQKLNGIDNLFWRVGISGRPQSFSAAQPLHALHITPRPLSQKSCAPIRLEWDVLALGKSIHYNQSYNIMIDGKEKEEIISPRQYIRYKNKADNKTISWKVSIKIGEEKCQSETIKSQIYKKPTIEQIDKICINDIISWDRTENEEEISEIQISKNDNFSTDSITHYYRNKENTIKIKDKKDFYMRVKTNTHHSSCWSQSKYISITDNIELNTSIIKKECLTSNIFSWTWTEHTEKSIYVASIKLKNGKIIHKKINNTHLDNEYLHPYQESNLFISDERGKCKSKTKEIIRNKGTPPLQIRPKDTSETYLPIKLEWSNHNNKEPILVNISTDNLFINIIKNEKVIENTFELSTKIDKNKKLYWRIGEEGCWSKVYSFMPISNAETIKPKNNEILIPHHNIIFKWNGIRKEKLALIEIYLDKECKKLHLSHITEQSYIEIDHNSIKNGATYYWRVKESDSKNQWSTISRFIILPNITPKQDIICLPSYIKWEQNTQNDTLIQFSPLKDDFSAPILSHPVSNTKKFTITDSYNLPRGVPLYWRVGSSNEWSITNTLIIYKKPSLISPENNYSKQVTCNNVKYTWSEENNNNATYHFQYSENQSFQINKNLKSIHESAVEHNAEVYPHYWRVGVHNKDGQTLCWSDPWKVSAISPIKAIFPKHDPSSPRKLCILTHLSWDAGGSHDYTVAISLDPKFPHTDTLSIPSNTESAPLTPLLVIPSSSGPPRPLVLNASSNKLDTFHGMRRGQEIALEDQPIYWRIKKDSWNQQCWGPTWAFQAIPKLKNERNQPNRPRSPNFNLTFSWEGFEPHEAACDGKYYLYLNTQWRTARSLRNLSAPAISRLPIKGVNNAYEMSFNFNANLLTKFDIYQPGSTQTPMVTMKQAIPVAQSPPRKSRRSSSRSARRSRPSTRRPPHLSTIHWNVFWLEQCLASTGTKTPKSPAPILACPLRTQTRAIHFS